MAINQLKAGALLSYASIGMSNIIGLLYTPFMLRMLGKAEFGLYALIASVVAYLTVLDFGLGNAVVRYTARYRTQELAEEQYALFGMFFALYSAISLLVLGAGVYLYHHVEVLFGSALAPPEMARARTMIVLLILNLSLTFPLSIFGSIISAYERYVFLKLVNLGRIILTPCLIIPLLLMGYKAVGMVTIITTLNILSLLINCWFCLARLKVKIRFRGFEWGLLKEVSGYSFFIFLGVIVDKVYWSSGQFILGIVAGTAVVAVYAIAIQLQMYYMTLSTALSGVFLPKVTAMVTRNTADQALSDLFIKTGRVQFMVMAFVLSAFLLFGKSFITFWAGTDYADAYLIAVLLMVPLTVPLIQTLGITILQARNQHKFRSIVYIIVALSSLAISIPLARVYGGLGCAVGTSLSLIVGNIVVMNIYYHRKIRINIPRFWKEILRMALPAAAAAAVGYLIDLLYPSASLYFLLTKVALYFLVYTMLMWWKGLNKYEKDLLAWPAKKLLSRVRLLTSS
ncbi:oligosaccharide flippase family protein [Pontibacter mangrovi]|uniref:Flippase n=1 Tax=Pontibacter mangrovi TaxID=2589816 RepID=A0A501VYL6_9BACT|nr:oligosaccharide flippase family protein [Pontibacter mangrovi]TPE42509.1 flippase [Pontibacter mangrovi]